MKTCLTELYHCKQRHDLASARLKVRCTTKQDAAVVGSNLSHVQTDSNLRLAVLVPFLLFRSETAATTFLKLMAVAVTTGRGEQLTAPHWIAVYSNSTTASLHRRRQLPSDALNALVSFDKKFKTAKWPTSNWTAILTPAETEICLVSTTTRQLLRSANTPTQCLPGLEDEA